MKCVICGLDEHRDADGMVSRCPDVEEYERIPAHVYLRELGRDC
jgi:hypothetical protein